MTMIHQLHGQVPGKSQMLCKLIGAILCIVILAGCSSTSAKISISTAQLKLFAEYLQCCSRYSAEDNITDIAKDAKFSSLQQFVDLTKVSASVNSLPQIGNDEAVMVDTYNPMIEFLPSTSIATMNSSIVICRVDSGKIVSLVSYSYNHYEQYL